jgi:hypothetical protein
MQGVPHHKFQSFSHRGSRLKSQELICDDLGVSENSVPLNPMVLLIIIPIKWLFHWEYTLFSDKPISAKLRSLWVYPKEPKPRSHAITKAV